MLSGRSPFMNKDRPSMEYAIQNSAPEFDENFSEDAKDIIIKLLQKTVSLALILSPMTVLELAAEACTKSSLILSSAESTGKMWSRRTLRLPSSLKSTSMKLDQVL